MKKILISILILMYIISSTALANTETSLKVLVNNKLVDFPDAEPLIQDSRTLIPVRFIAEKLGYKISWDKEIKQ